MPQFLIKHALSLKPNADCLLAGSRYVTDDADEVAELRKRAEQAKFIRDLATQYGVDVAEISQTQANLPAAMETAVAIAQEDNATP